MGKFKEYIKSIAAFWAALATFAAAVLLSGITFPSTVVGVLSVIAASGVIAGIVAGAPANQLPDNKILDQAKKAGLDLGVVVAGNVARKTSDVVTQSITDYVKTSTKDLPKPAKDQVNAIVDNIPVVSNAVLNSIIAQARGRL